MKTLLYTKSLSIGFRQWNKKPSPLYTGLNLHLQAGKLTCLLGRNGVGKTTLLQTLAGLSPSLNGDLIVYGKPLKEIPRRQIARLIAIVLAGKYSGGPMTVEQLVTLGRIPYTNHWGRFSEEDRKKTLSALESMDCLSFLKRDIHSLSDGERQKVMIARAIAQDPKILLLDEPTAFLDVPHRFELIFLLRRLAKTQKMTILFSTHDMEMAFKASDQIWLMEQESSFREGTPEDMVLSGVFEKIFQKEGVKFNLENGSFHLSSETSLKVNLTGEGHLRFWTEQALNKQGYYSINNSEMGVPEVVVSKNNKANQWMILLKNQKYIVYSIEDLMNQLSSLPELQEGVH